jgi:hypothetical protein
MEDGKATFVNPDTSAQKLINRLSNATQEGTK